MIKLIATDMDGTLLNDNKKISDNTYQIIGELLKKGILFVAISGRSLNNILYAFDYFKDDIIFCGDNGAQILYSNQEKEYLRLDDSIVKNVIKIAKESNIDISLNGLENVYTLKKEDSTYIKVLHSYGITPIEISKFEDIKDEIVKITVYEPKGSEKYALPLFSKIDNALVIVSGDVWLDISNLNCNKGEALKKILEKYSIKKEECVVFGDHLNDESLFKNADKSFAMKNAHPKLKEIASEICEYTNNEDGVYHKIRQLLNIKK